MIDVTTPKRRFRTDWLMYILFAAGLVGLLVWATRDELSRNPSREATSDLGPNGFITIRFSTSPYPPLPTGTVNLSFMPMDSRGRTVAIDSLAYEYGLAGATNRLVQELLSRCRITAACLWPAPSSQV